MAEKNTDQAVGNQSSESEPITLEKAITEGYLPRLDEHKSLLLRYLQFSPAAASEIARQAELFSLDEYYRLTDTGHESSSLEAMEFSHAHDIYKFYGAISEILLKSSPLETQALVKIFGRERISTPVLSLWSSQHKENLVRKLVDFRTSLSALLLPGSIEELTTLAWHSSQMHNEGTFALENMDCISKMYLTLSDLINTDRLRLGKKTIARIVQLYKLPVPVLKGVSRKEQREIEERLIQSYGHSNKYRSPVSSKLEKISAAIQQYHQYFDSRETLRLPVNDLAGLILKECKREEKAQLGSMTWEDFDSTRLESLFKVISYNLCQTLEEVVECAELNLSVEKLGYQVIRKISTGSFKEVYLVQDRLGTESVLKKISLSENARKFLQAAGVSLEDMMKKELANSPFKIKHSQVCSTFPLYFGDDFYILEEKYDQNAESFLTPYRKESIGQIRDFSRPRIVGEDYSTHYSLVSSGIEGSYSSYYIEAGESSGVKSVLLYPYSEIIIHLMSSMAEALQYCHQQGIVHGDVKLDNFGVKAVEEANTYLLSDFGLATRELSITGSEELTYRLGRVYTKAPELFHEGSHPTKATDAWSFGSVLYYLCTGRHPFSEELVDFSQMVEKEKYAKRVHELIRAETWGEVLRANIDKYLPRGFEIGYPIDGPYVYVDPNDILRTEAIVDRKIPADLQEILQLCFFRFGYFGQSFFNINHDFKEIQKYISERKGELINKYSEAGGFGG